MASPAGEADDPQLSAAGVSALLAATEAAVPAGSTALSVPAMKDVLSVLGRLPGAAPPRPAIDARLAALYSADVLVAGLLWFGALGLLGSGASPPPLGALPLGEVAEKLERRVERLVAGGLEAFWAQHGVPQPGGDGGSRGGTTAAPATLALLWALLGVSAFADLELSRLAAARAALGSIIAVLAATGVPRHRTPGPGYSLDDLLLAAVHIDVLWSAAVAEAWMAIGTGTPLALDPPRDFPSAGINMPLERLQDLPLPSQRPPNGPVPPDLWSPHAEFTAREWLGWLDPELDPPVADGVRARVLQLSLGNFSSSGIGYVMTLAVYAGAKVAGFASWLAEEAGLTVLEVLLAEEIAHRTGTYAPDSPAGNGPMPWAADIDRRYVEGLFLKPLLGEAIRRHRHYRAALDAIHAAVDPAVSAAVLASDHAAFAAAVPHLDGDKQQLLLGCLANLRHASMMLLSPAPFEDLDGWGRSIQQAAAAAAALEPGAASPTPSNPSSPPSPPSTPRSSPPASPSSPPHDPEDGPDVLRAVWFRSPPFRSALSSAIAVSSLSRLLARHHPDGLQASVYTPLACRSAVAAAWLHLLVLRRFRGMAASAGWRERAAAEGAYEGMLGDVEACLELLRASGKPAFAEVGVLLERLAEDDGVRLSRGEIQLLRTARRRAERCGHVEGGGHERGACWVCAAARSRGEETLDGEDVEGEGEAGGDPLAESLHRVRALEPARTNSFGSTASGSVAGYSDADRAGARRRGRRVRFAKAVEVFETWATEEYPGRSMHAPDGPEEGDGDSEVSVPGWAGAPPPVGEWDGGETLRMMLMMRGLMAE
ncbi:hypothetical protein DFJ74DRAFT_709934 [Hyaloraphidium curvatum]|nr:hypothetical protein DFJ74DRAFT_709934 [Hyaloraphidium curvatum]